MSEKTFEALLLIGAGLLMVGALVFGRWKREMDERDAKGDG